jgi:hypothetical protein
MKSLKSLLLIAALLGSVSSAAADIRFYASSGAWRAFAGTGAKGTPMCGMTVIGDAGKRLVMVKWQLGKRAIFVQLTKESWNIPAGIEMPIEVRFDSGGPFTGTAESLSDNRQMIEVSIANDDGDGSSNNLKSFMAQFMAAQKMIFSFPGGTEGDWFASMEGSRTIGAKFIECTNVYEKRYGGNTTQPYGGGNTTQPYSGNGTTQQPHGKQPQKRPLGRDDI